MKERPLLMSARDVRAILAGRKTQHRLVVKAPGWAPGSGDYTGRAHVGISKDPRVGLQAYFEHRETQTWHGVRCPYGQPGTRLWVRETYMDLGACYLYRADHGAENERDLVAPGQPWKPAIHMPRWASRITLEVTGVRVERLHGISEADAIAEGVTAGKYAGLDVAYARAYSDLWESINGPGSWDANPWVWCLEFKRVGDAA